MPQKPREIKITAPTIILIALLFFGAWFVYYEYTLGNIPGQPKVVSIVQQWTSGQYTYTLWSNGTTTTVVTGTGIAPPPSSQPLLLYFTAIDPISGTGAIASAEIYLYDTNNVMLENLTTAASGAIASALPYTPGTPLVAEIVKTNYVTRYVAFNVPSVATVTTYNQPVYPMQLQTIYLGSYTVKCVDSSGDSIGTGGFYNFTTNSTTSVSITFTVYEATDNKGYWSSYDPINAVNQNMIWYGSTTDSYVTVQGGTPYQRGTTTYYVSVLPDGYPIPSGQSNIAGLTRVKVGNNYPAQGICSVTYNFGKGSLTAGSTTTFSYSMYDYSDQSYFAANGVGGPNAANITAATFTLHLKA